MNSHIHFIKSSDPKDGIELLADKLKNSLDAGKKVLWLIAGGSNIPIATGVMRELRGKISSETSQLTHLTVSQTDERFGPVGHSDSNWKQLVDSGFDFSGIKAVPILKNLPLKETMEQWGKNVETLFAEHDEIIAQFGIGPDGHIGGATPHSAPVTSTDIVYAHEAAPFMRATLTLQTMRKIQAAYVFAFGPTKKTPLEHLKDSSISLDEQPAQILRELPEVYVFSDIF